MSQELSVPEKNSEVATEEPLQKKLKIPSMCPFRSPKKDDNATVYEKKERNEKKESTNSPEAMTKM